jgi:hypothetical protein
MIEFPEELIKQKLKEAEENIDWFYENKKELRKKYCNMFVAISNKNVIAASKDPEELVRKLKELGKEDAIVEFVEPENLIVVY